MSDVSAALSTSFSRLPPVRLADGILYNDDGLLKTNQQESSFLAAGPTAIFCSPPSSGRSLMLERLEHGSRDQKRAILFNLWRFYSRRDEVISVYLEYLNHDDDDLRFDALVLLGLVTDAKSHREVYVRSLSDPDPRIRALALRELSEFGKDALSGLKGMIERMLSDPEMGVKRAAMEVLKRL